MNNYLLTCRSLTYAQRTGKILERHGLKAAVVRTPPELSRRGCGYAVKLKRGSVSLAINVLENAGLMPEKVFLLNNDGSFEEVSTR